MSTTETKINISEKRILRITTHTSGVSSITNISEGFLEEDKVVRDYVLQRSEDYGFNAYSADDYDNFNTISFRFDINHPLYMPLFHLLNYDNELTIDDDDTRELIRKYLIIYKHGDEIFLDINNYLKYDLPPTCEEKFNVFIKNIVMDGRSKIDQQDLDTKSRLSYFFNEVLEFSKLMECLKPEERCYWQMSFEEYMLMNNLITDFEAMKKMFKIDYEGPYRRKRELLDFERSLW